jgi:hypothetical protein
MGAVSSESNIATGRYAGLSKPHLYQAESIRSSDSRDLFQAQINLAEIRLNELSTIVHLYKALG